MYLTTLTAVFETALAVTFDASVAALSAVCASAGIVTLDRVAEPGGLLGRTRPLRAKRMWRRSHFKRPSLC